MAYEIWEAHLAAFMVGVVVAAVLIRTPVK